MLIDSEFWKRKADQMSEIVETIKRASSEVLKEEEKQDE